MAGNDNSHLVGMCLRRLPPTISTKSKVFLWPSMVVHACNPSTLEAGGSQGQEIETILTNMVKPCLY